MRRAAARAAADAPRVEVVDALQHALLQRLEVLAARGGVRAAGASAASSAAAGRPSAAAAALAPGHLAAVVARDAVDCVRAPRGLRRGVRCGVGRRVAQGRAAAAVFPRGFLRRLRGQRGGPDLGRCFEPRRTPRFRSGRRGCSWRGAPGAHGRGEARLRRSSPGPQQPPRPRGERTTQSTGGGIRFNPGAVRESAVFACETCACGTGSGPSGGRVSVVRTPPPRSRAPRHSCPRSARLRLRKYEDKTNEVD